MRRLALVVALAVMLTARASAVTLIGFEQVTVANSSIGFTAGKITPVGGFQATIATCRLETAEIRWTMDGATTPTTTVGVLLEIGDTLTITGHDLLVNFRSIRTGASSGILSCHYTSP